MTNPPRSSPPYTQEQLLGLLHEINTMLCKYSMPRGGKLAAPCDCKYLYLNGHPHASSEATGCCEVRYLTDLLSLMTPHEYDRLLRRAERRAQQSVRTRQRLDARKASER